MIKSMFGSAHCIIFSK